MEPCDERSHSGRGDAAETPAQNSGRMVNDTVPLPAANGEYETGEVPLLSVQSLAVTTRGRVA